MLTTFPLTREVLELREPRVVSLHDEDPEPNEARLLLELGFDSLLMLPLVVGDELWALVEIYRTGEKSFNEEDAAALEPILTLAADALLATRS